MEGAGRPRTRAADTLPFPLTKGAERRRRGEDLFEDRYGPEVLQSLPE